MVISAQRTTEKDDMFFQIFAETANITTACQVSGYSRSSVYDWRKVDTVFAKRWEDAEQDATERLEAEMYRRATFGVIHEKPLVSMGRVVVTEVITEYSDTLAIFLAKARNPAKYRETIKIEVDWASEVKELGIDPQQLLAQMVETTRKQLEANANVIDVTHSMNESAENAIRTVEEIGTANEGS